MARATTDLGDCTEYELDECSRDSKPRDVARGIRLISNRFILAIWNARKNSTYSQTYCMLAELRFHHVGRHLSKDISLPLSPAHTLSISISPFPLHFSFDPPHPDASTLTHRTAGTAIYLSQCGIQGNG